jgi:3-carboxy-cis,cis-muconate cycloisomerase
MRTGCAANLEITQGLIFAEAVQMALAPKMGPTTAHSLVAGACRRASAERAHLREILAQEPKVTQVLDAQALAQLFDPERYLGATHAFIERVLAGHPAPAD